MTATEIIRQIETLPPEEQAKVVQFAYRLDARRKLSGGELSELAERLVDARDPGEAASLRAAIVQGFYGEKPHA
jgi:hypothetical protein